MDCSRNADLTVCSDDVANLAYIYVHVCADAILMHTFMYAIISAYLCVHA